MKDSSRMPVALALPLLAAVAALAAPVNAQAQAAQAWQFQAAIYGYFPSLSGSTRLPAGGGGSDVSVDIDQILENLQFTFMGSFEAVKGPWGVHTDLVYLNLGDTRTGSRGITIGGVLPAEVNATVDLDLKGSVWSLAGLYRVASTPTSRFDLLAGARRLDVEQQIDWTVTGNIGAIAPGDRSGRSEASLTNWDAIVGVKGRAALGQGGRWFAPFYADIGGGESKLTWQVMAGVGFGFGWGEVVAAWRVLDYEMKSGNVIEELSFNGPGIAAVFRW